MDAESHAGPQRGLVAAVAMVAAAMLMVELLLTRLFSVLFYYHYSFFAVSLVMSGLSLGGLIASRWNLQGMPRAVVNARLAALALAFSVGIIAGLAYLVFSPTLGPFWRPEVGSHLSRASLAVVVPTALAVLPGLIAAGAFLATAFARYREWIGRLYAMDLIGAALACLTMIPLMRQIQGPAALFVPALLAAAGGLLVCWRGRRVRPVGAVLLGLCMGGSVAGALSDGNLLDLHNASDEQFVLERWNEHSRIMVFKAEPNYYIIIDKSAGALMLPTPRREKGDPVPVQAWWDDSGRYLAYSLGRPLGRAAVIGVGGGKDLLAPLQTGARQVDGYEINRLLLDLLRRDFAHFIGVASWPEVRLLHTEGRVGIAHSGRRYDVIQASLTDTWAATAGGGMVLSENSLYTVEAWRTFLSGLSDHGILTMTRWYLRRAPAETQRLVSLAAEALSAERIPDPRAHVVLVVGKSLATILVSRSPFSAEEVERIRKITASEQMQLIAAPGSRSTDTVVDALLDPQRRRQAIAESPYDISAPTDLRPYFFLLYRPSDLLDILSGKGGLLSQITFRAMRVLAVLGGVAVGFALLVFLLALFTLPSASTTRRGRRIYRWMNVYFLGIGLGYILVQLSLHQCLILVLGHPTTALSVVLFSMLLGTALGAAASPRLFNDRRFVLGWLGIVGSLVVLTLAYPTIYKLGMVSSPAARALAAGGILVFVGFVLGFAFPLGVRLVAPTGEWAVQKMWAVNGAASIAGAFAAAVIGVSYGSRAVLLAGLCCYVVVALCGVAAARGARAADPTARE